MGTLMLEDIPSVCLVGSMEKHLRGLGFTNMVKLNTPFQYCEHSREAELAFP